MFAVEPKLGQVAAIVQVESDGVSNGSQDRKVFGEQPISSKAEPVFLSSSELILLKFSCALRNCPHSLSHSSCALRKSSRSAKSVSTVGLERICQRLRKNVATSSRKILKSMFYFIPLYRSNRHRTPESPLSQQPIQPSESAHASTPRSHPTVGLVHPHTYDQVAFAVTKQIPCP